MGHPHLTRGRIDHDEELAVALMLISGMAVEVECATTTWVQTRATLRAAMRSDMSDADESGSI